MSRLCYQGEQFLLDQKPFRFLSGTIHYFRVTPDYWGDRLKKLRACGFNAVETYTCWNLHERQEGKFDFSGGLDVARFVQTAQKLGLYVILRPGPYICAEMDFGGLPSWLLNRPGLALRCNNPLFLQKVAAYYKQLFDRLRPYLGENGGNIIAVQVENEYGSYGNDKDYLRAVAQIYRGNGVNEFFFTSDGPNQLMLGGGSLPEYLATANFGSRGKEHFDTLRRFAPERPVMCTEFWNGWFDHWYEQHHRRESDDTAAQLEEMMQDGGSVNLYMFHGGTNFGFTNGANHDGCYQPTVTSYDYDCPVSECGDLTEKYFAVKRVAEQYMGKAPDLQVGNLPKKDYGIVALTQQTPLFAHLPQPVESANTLTMEQLEQDFGFVLYETVLHGPFERSELTIDGLHDRAMIYVDGKLAGIQERTGRRSDSVYLELEPGQTAVLRILVENMGRINYGAKLLDRKGILRGVKLGCQYQFGWKHYPLTCDCPPQQGYESVQEKCKVDFKESGPLFLKGSFTVQQRQDTFVRLDGFTKGNVYINGFNLGRYWNPAGPQKTLYLPAPLLREGENELAVLELEGIDGPAQVHLTDCEDLG